MPTGKLRMLAMSSPQRSALLPELPTLKEGGVDVEANAWNALIAPAKTPGIDAIAREVNDALRDTGVREKLTAQMIEAVGTSPAESLRGAKRRSNP